MIRRFAAVGLLLLAAAGDPPKSDIVAQRGDVKLTAADIRAMLDKADPAFRAKAESSPAALASFVRDKMLDQALLAEAKAKGWDQKPDVQQRIADARDVIIVQSYAASLVPADPNFPSDEQIKATYEANKAKFMLPRQYHIAQIAIQVPQGASAETEEAARKKAADIRLQALKPKADFGALAKQYSQDKATVENGGDAGWIREDTLIAGIRDAVSGLADKGTSEVIRLPDGYHIVRLLGIKPPAPATLEEVTPQIVQALRQARTQQFIRGYVDAMLKAQPIELNEIDLARQVSAQH